MLNLIEYTLILILAVFILGIIGRVTAAVIEEVAKNSEEIIEWIGYAIIGLIVVVIIMFIGK